MANIFLTRKCNLKCPYCFADEFVNKKNEEVTLENFEKILNFIKKDGTSRIGLIGGEPTLHPDFNKILDILNNEEQIKRVIIYTNGLEIDKFLPALTNDKFHLLINCNTPSDIKDNYSKLRNNIILLKETVKNRYNLGINIYSKEMDYSYIFDLLKLTDQHGLRFSTAISNYKKEETQDIIESFMEIKPLIFRFFNDCYKNKIVPRNDCNSLPECLFTIEDKKVLLMLTKLASIYNIENPILSCHSCSPVIDILPDLTAIRCFGLSRYLRLNIKEFKSLTNLEKYFFNQIDLYAKLSFISENCENCKSRLYNRCGICYTYKLDKMETLKNFVKQNI